MRAVQGDWATGDKGYQMVNMENGEAKSPASPLIKAARGCDLESLKKLLEKGANLFETGPGGGSILHFVAANENFEAAISCTEEILAHTSSRSSSQLLKLINFEDKLKVTALMTAASMGNVELMSILLKHGAAITLSERNESLFYYIAKLGNHEQAIRCAEILFNLEYFENDANKFLQYLNKERNRTNRTPLHTAAIAGNAALVELFIGKGSDAMKSDENGHTVLHYAVDNAYEDKAVECTKVIMQDFLTANWEETKSQMLKTFSVYGRCPIHIAARRGFHEIIQLLIESYEISEARTGCTALHLAASLGDSSEAEACVKMILQYIPNADLERKKAFLNAQDHDGCTALYLSARRRNVEACKALLLAGCGFDIKNKRGKTPLEKVYEKIPQAVSVLLDEAVKQSGYVAYQGTIKTYAELDFGPILGYNTDPVNIYKETEDLAKVCYAKFEDRRQILHHPFIKTFIFKKWERISLYFKIFRIIHIIWFILNFVLLVTVYRVICPYQNAKKFSWTSLRPTGDEDFNVTKSLGECEMGTATQICGILNLAAVLIYGLSQIHQTKQRFHWLFRPVKSLRKDKQCQYIDNFFRVVVHYAMLIVQILPSWAILIGVGIGLTTLPILYVRPFPEEVHYMIAGVMGFLIWLSIYFELGKIPKFRVYINLLQRSTVTLLWAIAITAPILFGFATVFVVLMPGEASFSSASQSFVKVITFMIGELDYDGLFYGDKDNEGVFVGFVMLALAIFVVFIVLLLVNFLIGLAAEEIRDFGERAEIWKLCTKLEQIVMLESFLDETVPGIGKDLLKHKLMLMPPRKDDKNQVKQRRRAIIDIPGLPQSLQKELHELKLKTIREIN